MATTTIVGSSVALALLGTAAVSDSPLLFAMFAYVSVVAAVVVFCPLSLLASRIRRPFLAVMTATAIVAMLGGALFMWKFGVVSPLAGDKELLHTTGWSSLVAGQLVHTAVLRRPARPTAN
jgi:hypothetical protein